MDSIFKELLVFSSVVVGALLVVLLVVADGKRWGAFAKEHDCREMPTGGFDSNGAPVNVAYLCNDGKTYWR